MRTRARPAIAMEKQDVETAYVSRTSPRSPQSARPSAAFDAGLYLMSGWLTSRSPRITRVGSRRSGSLNIPTGPWSTRSTARTNTAMREHLARYDKLVRGMTSHSRTDTDQVSIGVDALVKSIDDDGSAVGQRSGVRLGLSGGSAHNHPT